VLTTLGRALATLFLCVLLVGFGVCGALGTINGASAVVGSGAWGMGALLIVMGVVGLLIAWGCVTTIRDLWRERPPTE
jgi:tellurite resistance protein TehA-like permease